MKSKYRLNVRLGIYYDAPEVMLPSVRLDAAFLPSVRTVFNHSGNSCLRDYLMLMLASGRNAIRTACSYLRACKAHKRYTLFAKRSTFVEIALQITLFYAKQTQSQVGRN